MSSPRRHIVLAATATCAALALVPAVASAEDFCVGGPAGCSGTPVASGGLKAALAAAQSNGTDDRFFLAPGIYSADAFSHKSPDRVQIIGAGAGKTILRGNLAGEPVLTLEGNSASSVSSLTVQPAAGMTAGLLLQGTHARDVTVDGTGAGLDDAYGAVLYGGGSFDDGRVDLGTNGGYAVAALYAGTVTGSTLHAPQGTGVLAGAGTATVRRSTLSAGIGAAADGSHLTVSDSVIGQGVIGLAADPGEGLIGTSATVDADRVTIRGAAIGAFAQADQSGETAVLHLRDSVISGGQTPVARLANNGATSATVTTDRSDYEAPAQPIDTGPGKLTETNHLSVAPKFVDEGSGDFHLAAGSPLIDAGTPGSVPDDAADLDGLPRASDGNGDCTRTSDIGAFEYQGTTVHAAAAAAAPSAAAGQPVGFSAAGSCIPGPGAPSIAWSFDDGASASGAAVSHAFGSAGRHTATVTVSDGHGHQASATASVDVSAPAGAPGTPAGPHISRLRVAPQRVHVGTALPRLVRTAVKKPLATIRFRVDERATVTLRFARLGAHGSARTVKAKVTIKARGGGNVVRFAGRLSRKVALKPGRYRVSAIATDAVGTRSAPVQTQFTVVRPAGR